PFTLCSYQGTDCSGSHVRAPSPLDVLRPSLQASATGSKSHDRANPAPTEVLQSAATNTSACPTEPPALTLRLGLQVALAGSGLSAHPSRDRSLETKQRDQA